MQRLGLALSGGGYRAAAFHLGVLRGLARLGLLDRVAVVSGVSGGALLAAAWACHRTLPFDAFEARLRRLLSRDLKPRVVRAALRPDRLLRLLVQPRYSLTEVLAEVLDRDLFDRRTLGSLRDAPLRLVVNATSLNHGAGFRFTPDEIGDARVSTVARAVLDAFPVARAVAASAAFPGGFAPIVLGREVFARSGHEFVLTDGGVDDNFGLEPLASCDALVVSDGSFPFADDARPFDSFGLGVGRRLLLGALLVALVLLAPAGWPTLLLALGALVAVLVLLRLRMALFLFGSVMMRGQRRGALRQAFASEKRRPCAWITLLSDAGEEQDASLAAAGVDRERVRRIPTDLALDPADLDALVLLGETLAVARVGEISFG